MGTHPSVSAEDRKFDLVFMPAGNKRITDDRPFSPRFPFRPGGSSSA
jgi:hypothetical protein